MPSLYHRTLPIALALAAASLASAQIRKDAPPIRGVPALSLTQLVLEFATGEDDLRGGNDNVHLIVLLRGGREARFDNANDFKRWMGGSINEVAKALPDSLSPGDVVGVRLQTTFGGGLGGDNWDLAELVVRVRYGTASDWNDVYYGNGRDGKPLVRFTGSKREHDFR